jgi:DNA-binding response OmpR family regulator/HPt (histidine-containing phosphotransfer) domain-containing protein
MKRILIAGLPDRLAAWLAQRLPGVAVEVAWTGDDALAVLGQGAWAALVIDRAVDGLAAEKVIRAVRSRASGRAMPVILTLDPDHDGAVEDDLRGLVSELRIDRVLLSPLDRGELARHVGNLLQTQPIADEPAPARMPASPAPAAPAAAPAPPAPPQTPVAPQPAALSAALAAVWERSLPSLMERIATIDQAVRSLTATGSLPRELRETAEREAHRLAGALGTFGSHEGTRLARAIESSLSADAPVGRDAGARIGQLAAALRREVDARAAASRAPSVPAAPAAPAAAPPAARQTPAASPPSGDGAGATLLALTDDAQLAASLAAEAAGRGMSVRSAALAQAPAAIDGAAPQAILLDVGEEEGAGWALLPVLSRRHPGVPLLVATSRDSLLDRVRVLQMGARVFLEKPFTAPEALDAVRRLLPVDGSAERLRVLAVDDDPQILDAVRALLQPQRLDVHTLDSPLRFWTTLRDVQPDLLILDVDMPFLDGIELCRVVRADHRWTGLPILFLTARTDPETILRVFAAGADDYVTKPVVGPELTTRVRNRLERAAPAR